MGCKYVVRAVSHLWGRNCACLLIAMVADGRRWGHIAFSNSKHARINSVRTHVRREGAEEMLEKIDMEMLESKVKWGSQRLQGVRMEGKGREEIGGVKGKEMRQENKN